MENSVCEYSVRQRIEGKWVLIRAGLIALYIFIPLFAAFLGPIFKNLVAFAAVGILIDVPVVLLTWRRTRVEYEYAMTGGTLVFSEIYGGSTRKPIFETELKTISAAFPYDSEKGRRQLSDYAPEVQYYALSTTDEERNREKEIWCCLFLGEDGKRSAFYFELTDTAYRYLRSYANAQTAGRLPQKNAPEGKDQ